MPGKFLTRSLSCLPHGPFHRAAWESPWHQSKWSKREQSGSHSIFYDLTLEVTPCNFHHILLVSTGLPYSVWQGTSQEHEYQEARIIAANLEAGYQTRLSVNKGNWNIQAIWGLDQRKGNIQTIWILLDIVSELTLISGDPKHHCGPLLEWRAR